MLGRRLKVSIDIFHHDHGGIDDDAEIDRAERQEIRIFSAQHQDDDGEEKRERNVGADDDGAPEIDQEYPLNEENQQTAKDEIVQNRLRGHSDQRAAIVIRNDLDPGGQASVAIEPGDFGLNARNDVVGMLGPPHHDDRRRDVIIVIPARDSKPRHVTDRDPRHVLDLDGKPARLGQDDVLDILDLVALGDVIRAAAVDQPDAANIDRLLSDRDLSAAAIDVRVAERAIQL